MANKNFMDFLGGGLVQGADIQSIDQRANIARFRCEDNHKAFAAGGPYVPCESGEYDAMRSIDKRKTHGGANFEKEDML